MVRYLEYTSYEIQSNGLVKNYFTGERKLKSLVGKNLFVRNKNKAYLYIIENAELSELEALQEGLLLTIIKDNKEAEKMPGSAFDFLKELID